MVDEGGYSKRISLSKNPNVNKKMWGGGGGCGGVGGLGGGWREFFLYESKFKIIPGGWKRRGWDMARVGDCLFVLFFFKIIQV